MAETAKHRIYTDADGNPVDEGDPKAAYLAAAEGDEIPADLAEKLKRSSASKATAKPTDKATPKSADK